MHGSASCPGAAVAVARQLAGRHGPPAGRGPTGVRLGMTDYVILAIWLADPGSGNRLPRRDVSELCISGGVIAYMICRSKGVDPASRLAS